MSLKIKRLHCSINQKLLMLITSITAAALLCASIATVYSGRQLLLERLQEDMENFAELTAMNSSAAVLFEDKSGARKMLENLRTDPSIMTVALYKTDHQILAQYTRQGAEISPPSYLPKPSVIIDKESIRIAKDIIIDNEKIGGIYLESDLSRLDAITQKLVHVLIIISISVLFIAMLFSVRLQRLITTPILRLTRITKKVTQTRDFSNRARKTANDEVGTLIEGFNQMMDEIESRDRTLQQNNHELAIARQDAIDASEAKGNFLAKMSHEIRTSMNGVLGMLELLDDTLLQDEQQDFARTARNSASALLNVIDDVLDFSKIEAGCLEIENIDMELLPLCEDVAALLAEKAHNKGVELTCLVHSDVPAVIVSDPTRLRQVLLNLMSNSIKFTAQGEVGLQVSLLETCEDSVTLKFAVNDTGIGISPEQQHKLFNAFSQVDISTTRQFGGTGLGLSICKQLVELMHGSIHVDSEAGKGATFWFQLQVKISELNHPNTEKPQSIADKKILIIDDNETSRLILEYYCHKWGIAYSSYAQVKTALHALSQDSRRVFGGAIIDMQMPEMEGMQAIAKIRDNILYSQLPVLLLSSTTRPVLTQNIDACLMKPVRQASLFKSLSKLLSPREPLLFSENKTVLPVFEAHVLLVDDNHVNQKVASNFLKKLKITVDVCDNGEEALTMIQQHHYDLVFMDCQMPVMDGYLATQTLRKKENKDSLLRSHLTVIAMTANVLAGEKEKCLKAGMDDYLEKPVQLSNLIKLLAKWLPEKEQALEQKPIEIKEKTHPDTLLRQNANNLHMDYALYQALLNDFYREHKQTIESIKSLLANNEYEAAMLSLHRLKGTAGNLGFQTIFDIATAIEKNITTCASRQVLSELFNEFIDETDSIMTLISQENNETSDDENRSQSELKTIPQLNEILSSLSSNLRTHNYAAKRDYEKLAQRLQAEEYMPIMQQIAAAINQLNYQQANEWLNKLETALKRIEIEHD